MTPDERYYTFWAAIAVTFGAWATFIAYCAKKAMDHLKGKDD